MGTLFYEEQFLTDLSVCVLAVKERHKSTLQFASAGCSRTAMIHSTANSPSIAFRHLPPNSARISYDIEGALFISAQLSTDAVSAIRKAWVLIRP